MSLPHCFSHVKPPRSICPPLCRPATVGLVHARRIGIALLWLFAALRPAAVAETAPTGWSADLLNQILKSDVPAQQTPANNATAEVVLHTYQLSHLRIGEAGKAQNVLAILGKLLPPGSSVNPDIPANSLHVLTTPAAHKAVWDYLSAVDVSEPARTPVAAVPEDVQAAIKKLASTSDQSAKLAAAVGSVKTDVSREIAAIEARQNRQTWRLAGIGAGFALAGILGLGWAMRRGRSSGAPAPDSASALALAPEQLTSALVPVQDKMRNEMLGVLNEVAIKLQAQHNEQQQLVREQQQQLENARQALADERRQFITEAGTMVVQAVERVDATTAKLARQQDKVAELVQELQNTVRELDDTKDSLRDREVELEQERAKIAALSLLLEEGAPIPADALTNGHRPTPASDPLNTQNAAPVTDRCAPATPCMTIDPITPTMPLPPVHPNGSMPPPRPPARFTFLPPEHPES